MRGLALGNTGEMETEDVVEDKREIDRQQRKRARDLALTHFTAARVPAEKDGCCPR